MSDAESPDVFESQRPPEPAEPAAERPDWLVGAEEGAQSEQARGHEPSPHLKLVQPAGGESPGAAGAAKKPVKPQAWKAAASSVPRLQRVEGTGSAPSAAPPGRPAAPAWAGAGQDAGPEAREGPPLDDLPFDARSAGTDDPLVQTRAPAAPLTRRARLDEPWWAIAADALQTSRVLQLGMLAVLLAVVAWFMWPRSEPTVSIHSIREHPERFDGTTVRVKGRVGDVYEVGGAFAFYLQQGRDTIVVFSRTRRPYRNEKLQVAGSVSMGYLDGVARPSLFESTE